MTIAEQVFSFIGALLRAYWRAVTSRETEKNAAYRQK